MNEVFVALGIDAYKPLVDALLLPPVPFVLLVLVGGRLMFRHRALAWTLLLVAAAGTWAMCTPGLGRVLTNALVAPPRALVQADLGELKHAPHTAIVVLGAGAYPFAPEYGMSNLKPLTFERLRYGVWLARATGLPLAVSGGIGWGADPETPSEAEIAARIAVDEFKLPLRWTETRSRDTNENAIATLELLRPAGIERIVLVTHAAHMRRALAAFRRAAARESATLALVPAPVGLRPAGHSLLVDWLPSSDGYATVRYALHEWVGRLAGA